MVLRVIFVLALAFACVQASPLRSGFLGRLWRRSTDLVQPTPSPAQGEIATTGQAQHLEAAIASHHAVLATLTRFICRRIGKLYDNYKVQRFPQGSQQTVSDYSFGENSGNPLAGTLPDTELVRRHYNTLSEIVKTLAQVGESETANVTRPLERITANISLLIRTLDNTMTLMNTQPTDEPTARPFGNATLTDQERNQRTLHILEAAKNYMEYVKEDYRVLNSRIR